MGDPLPSPWSDSPARAALLRAAARRSATLHAPAPEAIAKPRPGLLGRIWQGFLVAILTLVGAALLAVAGSLGLYAYYAQSLPSPDELYQRAVTFQSARIYDRHGRLLFEFFDPNGGRRTVARYDDLPPVVVAATVATEDASFFTNPGVNPLATVRALWQDLRHGEMVFGGSTITQQVVKNLFLTRERTVERKVQEAILATEITRRYTKPEILEVYLNDAYFGNLAYGIGAAANTYFGKDVSDLALHEAAMLAGLIQAPVLYDPYTDPEAALNRRAVVLGLMERRGHISAAQADEANAQPLGVQATPNTMRAPHMVMHVRQELETLVGQDRLYREGLQVYTTLDLDLQQQAEEAVRQGLVALEGLNATNAAVVALDPHNGDILALVGSADFWSEAIAGQVNVALQPRQVGSTIKPFVYLAALERGLTAGSLLMDVPRAFPDGANGDYRPTNNDNRFWGPMSLRTALATSRNVPAVETLVDMGIEALLDATERVGVTIQSDYHGAAQALGAGEATLLEMTAGYGALANGGYRVTPRAIVAIYDPQGSTILAPETPAFPQVMDPRHAYVLTDILADPEARAPAFGAQNVLNLPFPAAAKTGTTDKYKDSWAIGYTPSMVAGVWVGNSDNTEMEGVSGARGAGAVWAALMTGAPQNASGAAFAPPEGLVAMEVCPLSGHPRGEHCPPGRMEIFVAEQAPTTPCPVHAPIRICTVTGRLAGEHCPADVVQVQVLEDIGPRWDEWATAQGRPLPPREVCDLHTSPTRVHIGLPSGTVGGVVDVYGATEAPGFTHYVMEVGQGPQPVYWERISPPISAPVADGVLFRWDTRSLPDGVYTLRVVVEAAGHTTEARATAEVHNASPTPLPTHEGVLAPRDDERDDREERQEQGRGSRDRDDKRDKDDDDDDD